MLFCQECGDRIEGVSDYHPFCSDNCEELFDEGTEEAWEEDYDLEDQFDDEEEETWDDYDYAEDDYQYDRSRNA